MTFDDYAALSVSRPVILFEMDLSAGTVGYCDKDFTPIGSPRFYEGRLTSIFDIGRSRDALTWGKIEYSGGTVTLNNSDGHFDSLTTSNWFVGYYGKVCRMKIGYEELDYDDYKIIWSGYVETIELSVNTLSLNLMETRKKLADADITCRWTNKNAMDALKEIIQTAYPGDIYNDTYFDTTAWELASAQNCLISLQALEPKKSSEVIDNICTSIFGLFFMTPDNRYSFRIVNPDATALTTISSGDVISEPPAIQYDPTNIVSSVIINCEISYDADLDVYVKQCEDKTREAYVSSTYSIINKKTILTYLPSTDAALQKFATQYLDYCCDVHGTFSIDVPMKYYTLEVGDTVNVELKRNGGVDYAGTQKCEILSKMYKLDFPMITLGMRICYEEA